MNLLYKLWWFQVLQPWFPLGTFKENFAIIIYKNFKRHHLNFQIDHALVKSIPSWVECITHDIVGYNWPDWIMSNSTDGIKDPIWFFIQHLHHAKVLSIRLMINKITQSLVENAPNLIYSSMLAFFSTSKGLISTTLKCFSLASFNQYPIIPTTKVCKPRPFKSLQWTTWPIGAFIFVVILLVFHLLSLSFPLLLQLFHHFLLFCFYFPSSSIFFFFITLLCLLPLLIASSLVMHITLGMPISFSFFFFFFGLKAEAKVKVKKRKRRKKKRIKEKEMEYIYKRW